MSELSGRVQRAAETILENERLTDGLDDQTAEALLDWGLASAERIAFSTVGLNELEADRDMEPRLRATRRLMRRVRNWVVYRVEMDAETTQELFSGVVEQAALIYEDFSPPPDCQRQAFLSRWRDHVRDPISMIAQLRVLIEDSNTDAEADPGRPND